ncbi:MAG TPA: sigma-54 dependent transcriptional regulator [Planctomycetota bacterium]|nr:sigma-54 dependent transcriptional regulator [Planctomycetota bacterium]
MSTTLVNNVVENASQPAALVMPAAVEGNYVPLSSLRRGATVWGMVGVSEALRKLQDRIRSAATSELSVLIIGETGSGKELVANAIHQESKRSHQRFVAVNTGAIPRELVASELFGHVKGSFTGALKDRDGRFVEADGGTLFLDELGTMDARTQIGLLRALEQRVIQPVGSSREIPVNVRIVAATNCNLVNEVKAGSFREDLYYRLESFVIPVPPLRQRKEDIPALAAYFAEKVASEDGREMKGFTAQALHDLCSYDWPGNVRELRNAVSQAVILSATGLIDSSHLPDKISAARKMRESESIVIDAPQPAIAQPVQPRIDDKGRTQRLNGAQIQLSLEMGLDSMVVQIMQKTLEVCNGNVTRAAQILGISRKTIYNRLRSEGLGKDRMFAENEANEPMPPQQPRAIHGNSAPLFDPPPPVPAQPPVMPQSSVPAPQAPQPQAPPSPNQYSV